MPSERPVILTADGKEDLEHELRILRTVKIPAVTDRIQQLSLDGDVSDNSEYEDTKEELMLIEARMREIENMLRHAQVITSGSSHGIVQLGSRVTITDETGLAESWILVSPEEANTLHGKISTQSPVGAAVLGKAAGDQVVVRTPGGESTLTIDRVE